MSKWLTFSVVAVLLLTACDKKKQVYQSANGQVVATASKGGKEWKITNAEGREVVERYDSMRVVETGENGHPMTLYYCTGEEQLWLQYYSDMQLRSRGTMMHGKREGRWVFYHPNGAVQCEATYVDGLEEGPYKVYRETGTPFYLGQYHQGKRTGRWEFYSPEGDLEGTKEY